MNLEELKQKKGHYIMMFSLPAIIAMLLTAVVTVTDGFFVGNYVGKEGLAAVNVGLPIVYLLLACGMMSGVGGSAIAGILNGDGKKEACRSAFNQTVVTALVISAAVSLLIFGFFRPVQMFLGAQGELGQHFCNYYKLMLLYYPVMVVNTVLGMFIRAEGKPQAAMMITVFGVVVNVVLDAVFCRMGYGIRGVAAASIISGVLALVPGILFFVKAAQTFRFGRFAFDKEVFRSTMLNGSSEFVGEMASCISMFCYNHVILRIVGSIGVSAFTVAGYTIFLFSMVVIGFGQGMSPIVSYVWGAGEHGLAEDYRKLTCRITFAAGVVFSAVMVLAAGPYSLLFVKDAQVGSMVQEALIFFVVSFLLMGYNIITSMYFTSCGKAFPSALSSVMRGIVFLLICIFVLPELFGMRGVWLSAPVTEVLSMILTTVLLQRYREVPERKGVVYEQSGNRYQSAVRQRRKEDRQDIV